MAHARDPIGSVPLCPTTGATVEACTRVLKRAGAARVDVLTLARAMRLPAGGGLP
jgi:hypothetical protein